METTMEKEALMTRLLDMLRDEERPAFRQRIERTLEKNHAGDAQGDQQAIRYLQDLDIFMHMRGADFIYSRGIAETLRVGEEIFELAYAMKRAMR